MAEVYRKIQASPFYTWHRRRSQIRRHNWRWWHYQGSRWRSGAQASGSHGRWVPNGGRDPWDTGWRPQSKAMCPEKKGFNKYRFFLWFGGILGSASRAEFTVSLSNHLAIYLDCSTAALTTHQKVVPIWKLVELKMIDFSDRTWTGISILTSAADTYISIDLQ